MLLVRPDERDERLGPLLQDVLSFQPYSITKTPYAQQAPPGKKVFLSQKEARTFAKIDEETRVA